MKMAIQMLRCLRAAAWVLAWTLVSCLAIADSITWTNVSGGAWGVAENWTPNRIPGAADTAKITNSVAVTVSGTASIGSFSLGKDASLTVDAGGVLEIAGTASGTYVSGPLTNRGTILWKGGSIQVHSVRLGYPGEIWNEATGVLDIQGDGSLSSDYYYPIPLHNAGIVRKSAGSGTSEIALKLDNTGTVTCSAGQIRFRAGGTLLGHFTADAGCSIQFEWGLYVLGSDPDWRGPGEVKLTGGLLRVDLATGSIDASGSRIVGDSHVTGGTLNLVGGAVEGRLTQTGGTLTMDGTKVLGQLTIAGGTANWSSGGTGGIAAWTVEGVEGAAIVTVRRDGALNLIDGFSGTFTNQGTIRWTGGTGAYSTFAGGMWNETGALIDIQGDYSSAWQSGQAAPLHNAGILRKSSGNGAFDIGLEIDNTGLVECLSGRLRFLGGGWLHGRFVAGSGAGIHFAGGPFVIDPYLDGNGPGEIMLTGGSLKLNLSEGRVEGTNVTLSGDNRLTGGTVNLQGGSIPGSLTQFGGYLQLSDTELTGQLVLQSGIANWSGGGSGKDSSITVNAGANLLLTGTTNRHFQGPITNRGSIRWLSGPTLVYGYPPGFKGEIWNEVGGLIEIQCDEMMGPDWSHPQAVLHNAGLVLKSAGSGTSDIRLTLENQGTVTVAHGSLRLGANWTTTLGQLRIGISSPTDFGRIILPGTPTLGGALAVDLSENYVPATGTSFPVVAFPQATGTGEFRSLLLPDSVLWQPDIGSNGMKLTVSNVKPVMSAVPEQVVRAGQHLNLALKASDGDEPLQQLTYSLLHAPSGAALDPITGRLAWQARVSDAGKRVPFSVEVIDNSSHPAWATRMFEVVVPPLGETRLTALGVDGAGFRFQLHGDIGPTYEVQASDGRAHWETLISVTPASMPAVVQDTVSVPNSMQYYRVRLGPD